MANSLIGLRRLMPLALVQFQDWKCRFRDLGMEEWSAWMAAMSPLLRNALLFSRVEHLPPSLRTSVSLVIDIGANKGQWLKSFARFVHFERALAFEPNPEAFAALAASLKGTRDVRLYNRALGERSGVGMLNLTRASDLASMLRPADLLPHEYTNDATTVIGEIPVTVSALDEFVSSSEIVDLIKLDVQGYERNVLAGATATIARTRCLLIETNFRSHYQGDETFAELAKMLVSDLGFEFWDICPPHRGTAGRALWADVVFVNPRLEPQWGWLKRTVGSIAAA